MLGRALLASGLALGLCAPASATGTGTISCVSEEGASVDMTIGSLPILAVVSAYVQVGGESWSTDGGEIGGAQAFAEEDRVLVDFTDPDVSEIVARLRLFRALEGSDFAMAGTLQIPGTGAYALVCIGP